MSNLLAWVVRLLNGMGDALFHPYRDNQPPAIGFQPFTGESYKNKRMIA